MSMLRVLAIGFGFVAIASFAACAQPNSNAKVHQISEADHVDSSLDRTLNFTYAKDSAENKALAQRSEGMSAFVLPVSDKAFDVSVSFMVRDEQDETNAHLVKARGRVESNRLTTLPLVEGSSHFAVQVRCVRAECDEIVARLVEKRAENTPDVSVSTTEAPAAWEQQLKNYAQIAVIFVRAETLTSQAKAKTQRPLVAKTADSEKVETPATKPRIDTKAALQVRWTSGNKASIESATQLRAARQGKINGKAVATADKKRVEVEPTSPAPAADPLSEDEA